MAILTRPVRRMTVAGAWFIHSLCAVSPGICKKLGYTWSDAVGKFVNENGIKLINWRAK